MTQTIYERLARMEKELAYFKKKRKDIDKMIEEIEIRIKVLKE